MSVLTDHISKEMNELNLIRCQKIPKRPGADWHDLPDEKVQQELVFFVSVLLKCYQNEILELLVYLFPYDCR